MIRRALVLAVLLAAASAAASPRAIAPTHGVWLVASQGDRVQLLDVAYRELRTASLQLRGLELGPIATVASLPAGDRTGLAFEHAFVPFDGAWLVVEASAHGPFVPRSLRRLAEDGTLSPPLYTFTGKLAFVAPSIDGHAVLVGYFDQKQLWLIVVGRDGTPVRPPVAALAHPMYGYGATGIGVPGGFLVASTIGGEAPAQPLDLFRVGPDGAVSHLDTIPQTVQRLTWARGDHRAWMLASADEGSFAVPFGFDGKQLGKPLQLDPKPLELLAATTRAGSLWVIAAAAVSPVYVIERRLDGRGRAIRHVVDRGDDYVTGAAWLGDRAYVVWSRLGGSSFVASVSAR